MTARLSTQQETAVCSRNDRSRRSRRTLAVRPGRLRPLQCQRRAFQYRVAASPVLRQRRPVHGRDGPVRLRAADDRAPGGGDAGRAVVGVGAARAPADTPRLVPRRNVGQSRRGRLPRRLRVQRQPSVRYVRPTTLFTVLP